MNFLVNWGVYHIWLSIAAHETLLLSPKCREEKRPILFENKAPMHTYGWIGRACTFTKNRRRQNPSERIIKGHQKYSNYCREICVCRCDTRKMAGHT